MNTCYVFVLSSRRQQHLVVRSTPDLKHGIRLERRRLARRLARKRVYQKLVYLEAYAGLSAAVEREIELRNWSVARIRRLVQRVNPLWKPVSISGYLARSGGVRAVESR
ncbi:MAG: hypothetical protein ACFHX7_25140 [Pseudomonadota bacterium]